MKHALDLIICERVISLGKNGSFGFLCSGYNAMCLSRHLKLKFFCISFKGEEDGSCKECHNVISTCFPIEIYEFKIVWIILLDIHLKIIWRHCFGCSKLANLVLKTSRNIFLASEGTFTLLMQTSQLQSDFQPTLFLLSLRAFKTYWAQFTLEQNREMDFLPATYKENFVKHK